MSAQGLETLDHTVHLTHEWINELTATLGWASKRSALRLLRTVLHELRDRLHDDELAQFSAQVPLLIRGMLFEGWVPKRTPIKERQATSLIDSVGSEMANDMEYRDAADITAVFELLNSRISRGEVEDLRATMPEALRAIWPAP